MCTPDDNDPAFSDISQLWSKDFIAQENAALRSQVALLERETVRLMRAALRPTILPGSKITST